MADLRFIQVATDGTGKKVRNAVLEEAGSTVYQQVVVIAGATGDIIDAQGAVPSSSAFSLPVYLQASSSGKLVGAVTGTVAPTSQWTVSAALAAASTISVAPTTQWTVTVAAACSSAGLGSVLLTTALAGSAIDPRQATIVGGTSNDIGGGNNSHNTT